LIKISEANFKDACYLIVKILDLGLLGSPKILLKFDKPFI